MYRHDMTIIKFISIKISVKYHRTKLFMNFSYRLSQTQTLEDDDCLKIRVHTVPFDEDLMSSTDENIVLFRKRKKISVISRCVETFHLP